MEKLRLRGKITCSRTNNCYVLALVSVPGVLDAKFPNLVVLTTVLLPLPSLTEPGAYNPICGPAAPERVKNRLSAEPQCQRIKICI